MKVCLLFEQSGTFKRIFNNLGHNAVDVDIANDYGETDIQIDLFACIENNTIKFINNYDLVIAFYPCTWFSNSNDLIYRRQQPQFKTWSDKQIDIYINNRLEQYERAKMCLIKMIDVCNVPLIIENPRSTRICEILGQPQLYIKDRSIHGDVLKKPTFFYCYNGCKINDLDIIVKKRGKDVVHLSKNERSLISHEFALNFISKINY